MENNIVYHYTTIDALLHIIRDTDVEDKKICLLATDFEFLNDPNEAYHGTKIAIDYLSRVEDKLNIENNKRITDIAKKQLENLKENSIYKDSGLGYNFSMYVLSFSEAADNLAMWGMYASNGNGISLGFDWMPIWAGHSASIKKVIYDNDNEGIFNLVEMYYSEFCKFQTNPNTLISLLMRYVGLKIKTHHYFNEQEWRLCFPANISIKNGESQQKIKFRERNGSIIPYYEIFYPSYALKKIIIGPTRDFEQTKKSILLLLNARGININSDNIIPSEVPYRG